MVLNIRVTQHTKVGELNDTEQRDSLKVSVIHQIKQGTGHSVELHWESEWTPDLHACVLDQNTRVRGKGGYNSQVGTMGIIVSKQPFWRLHTYMAHIHGCMSIHYIFNLGLPGPAPLIVPCPRDACQLCSNLPVSSSPSCECCMIFWRTSRIFNWRHCLFGKMSWCWDWKAAVAGSETKRRPIKKTWVFKYD